MKTWMIKLRARDEKSAITYLKILLNTFKAGAQMKEDVNDCVVDDHDKNEKLICTLTKRTKS